MRAVCQSANKDWRYDGRPASPTTGARRLNRWKMIRGWQATKEAKHAGCLSECQ